MARRQYRLDFLIDSTRAEAAARRTAKALADVEAAARRAGAAMSAAYKGPANVPGGGGAAGAGGGGAAGSAIEDRYFKADYARRVAYEARKQRQAEAAAAATARTAQSEADQLGAIQDRHVARDYARRVAYERRRATQKEREGAQLAKIEDRYLMDEYRRRVAFEAQKDRDAEAAVAAREAAILRSAKVLTAAAFVGLRVLEQGYQKIREDAERAAEASIQLRKTIRMDAALKGAEGPGGQQVLESLKFRAQTGLGQIEAGEFARQYIGNVNIGLEKKNITQDVADRLMIEAGTRAARKGGDARTHAELAGLLGQFGKIATPEVGLAQLEAVRAALVAGRGEDPELTQQLLNTAGAMVREGGPVGTLPEMAALVGTMSVTAGPQMAGTRTEQLVRGLRAGLYKFRAGAGTKEPQGKYLKRIGVKETDSLEEMLGKVIPDLRKAKAAGRDIGGYLSEHGFRSDQERKALLEMESNYDVFVQRMARSREAGGAVAVGAGEVEANRRFLAGPLGQAGVTEALQTAATETRGIRGMTLRNYMAAAEASPEFQAGEKSIGGYLGDIGTGLLMGKIPMLTGDPHEEGRRMRMLGVAGQIQRRKAKAAGVTDREITAAVHQSYAAGSEEYTAESFRLIDALIAAKGGGLGVDIAPTMDALKAAIDENNRLLRENNARMGPAPPVAAKAPAPLPAP